MLGEMPVTSGRVMTYGSVAYVPQEAWVISDTVRQNILLGRTIEDKADHELYQEVLETCELSQVKTYFPLVCCGNKILKSLLRQIKVSIA